MTNGGCTCSTTLLPSPAGEIIVLWIAGEVDLSSRQLVQTAVDASIDQHPSHLQIDLSRLVFCDGATLALLVRAGLTAAARGIGYSISAPPRQAERVWVLLWPAVSIPTRHASAGAGVIAAMAGQNAQRHGTQPGPNLPDQAALREARALARIDPVPECADRVHAISVPRRIGRTHDLAARLRAALAVNRRAGPL
ncbi:STAS domain-containing protein [Actinomycetes bacterium KLBMP 9759]